MPVNVNPSSGGLEFLENDQIVNSVTITGDHDGSANKAAPVRYGTADPPDPPTGIPNGTLYLKYTP